MTYIGFENGGVGVWGVGGEPVSSLALLGSLPRF
jgi:hypothetical protein